MGDDVGAGSEELRVERARRGRGAAGAGLSALTAVVVGCLIASVVLFVNRETATEPRAQAPEAEVPGAEPSVPPPDPGGDDGVAPPSEWDPRVVEIVEFVEAERGLRFRHPVAIDFMPADEFVGGVTGGADALSDEQLEEVRRQEAQLRSLGLLGPHVDTAETFSEMQGAGLAAYYSPETKRISVRGTELTPAVRAIVAHEVTHALQDQHFDLGPYLAPDEPDAAWRRRAVVEGDASLVQGAYASRGLTGAEREAAADEELRMLEQIGQDHGDPALATILSLPYIFGPAVVSVVRNELGLDGLDELFRTPLSSDSQLLDPGLYLDGILPSPAEAPPLPDGSRLVHEGEMGAFSWLMVLAPHAEATGLVRTMDGWQSDHYSVYEHDGRVCTSATINFYSRSAADTMESILASWAQSMAAGGAVAIRTGARGYEIASCDPGEAAPEVDGDVIEEVVRVAFLRLALAAGMGVDMPFEAAWCLADQMVRIVPSQSWEAGGLEPDLQLIESLARECDYAL